MTAKKKPARTSKKPTVTTTIVTWRHVKFRVRHTPDYIIKGTNHLEVFVLSPKNEPLPITSTGYLSHFDTHRQIRSAKEGAEYFLSLIAQEEKTKRWQCFDAKRRQGDLFA